jgi:hypothetical protein
MFTRTTTGLTLSLTMLVSFDVRAECPSDVIIQDELTCSSNITGSVDHEAESYLGGDCEDEACYTCGDPYADEDQIAPEAVYSFTCQLEGTVSLQITDLPCDLDIYVLDDSCDPYQGCLYGSTASYAVDDQVDFTCTPGDTYYIAVEAYGTEHLDVASGPCTDTGDAEGTVYSPSYTLSFDVSASTGCAEDCDNGEDDDLDGLTDCEDTDCWVEPLCCDIDGDGYFAEDCDGDDCDDTDPTVYPGAPEDGGTGTDLGDGIDNDCDSLVDEDTDSYDDDLDGYSEVDGDCDDDNPGVHPDAEDIPGNGIDEDCDGEDALIPDEADSGDTATGDVDDDSGKDDGSCGCQNDDSTQAWLWLLLPLAAWRRRT